MRQGAEGARAGWLAAALVLALSPWATGCCRLAGDAAAPAPEPTAVPTPPPSPPEAPVTPEPRPAADELPALGDKTPAGPDPKLARNFYVVFDGSGSMAYRQCSGTFERKLPAAQWAFGEFLKAVEPEANLGLLVFDKAGLREVVPLGPGHRDVVERAVGAIRSGKGTPLGAAVRLASRALAAQHERQLGYGEYHLVVVTDGAADSAMDLKRAVVEANREGFLIHTIGFCVDADNALRAASYSYRTASDPAELREAVLSVLAEAEDFQAVEFEAIK